MKNMKYFTDCKTLDEAKKHYYKLVLAMHPDRGGSHEAFIEMQTAFEKFTPESEKFTGENANFNRAEYQHIIEQLIVIPQIEIEIVGSWIWITSPKEMKEMIKAVEPGESFRRGWSQDKCKWYFSPAGYRKTSKRSLSFEEITGFYGSEKVTKSERAQVTA